MFFPASGEHEPAEDAYERSKVKAHLNGAEHLAIVYARVPCEIIHRHHRIEHHGQKEQYKGKPRTTEGAALHGEPEAREEIFHRGDRAFADDLRALLPRPKACDDPSHRHDASETQAEPRLTVVLR